MPLHTDYRPLRLDEITGNKETIVGLKSHLQKKSPNRSLLFIGPSGCGKTTLAICVANELESYDSWNFKMLNASDFRGIDTVRDIREQAGRKPLAAAKNRIWLFDECHKLTADAQEAILKLLEDPPRDCWFFLATTNPEKLKITLRRRCTEYQVNPLSDREISILLIRISRKEGKRVPNSIIQQISMDSLGSPGIALNVLDKVIDLAEEEMARAAKKWAERSSNVITLCRAMLKNKGNNGKGVWEKILCPILKEIEEEDPETIRRQVLEYFRKVLVDGNESAYSIMNWFESPYYDTGRAGLTLSVYRAFCLD